MDVQDDIDVLQLDADDEMEEFSIREEIIEYDEADEYDEVEPEQPNRRVVLVESVQESRTDERTVSLAPGTVSVPFSNFNATHPPKTHSRLSR